MAIFCGTRDLLVADLRRLVERLGAPGMPAFSYHEAPRDDPCLDDLPDAWRRRRSAKETAEFIARCTTRETVPA